MTEDTEIDVEQLRTELDHIKDAMGIQERYPSQFQIWLIYGVLVAIAAVGSQLVVLLDLPGWGHWVSWGATMGLGGVYQWATTEGEAGGSTEAKPDIWLQYLAAFAYALVVLAIVAPLLADASAPVASSTIFAIIVGGVGLAYLVAGNALKAYYIRRRDRYAFYLGGVWMFVLAALIPHVAILRQWGYAVFGIAFGVHALGSYIVLSRG